MVCNISNSIDFYQVFRLQLIVIMMSQSTATSSSSSQSRGISSSPVDFKLQKWNDVAVAGSHSRPHWRQTTAVQRRMPFNQIIQDSVPTPPEKRSQSSSKARSDQQIENNGGFFNNPFCEESSRN
jgi:hypothetical protein